MATGTQAKLTAADISFFGHPRGLATLFMTELWERFSYYGLRALLILFMTASAASGGLGFDTVKAGAVYSLYASMGYMLSLPGGWVADRIIGQRRAVLYGGIVIAAGNFCLTIPSLAAFYFGLALIAAGTGLLKPNVSVIVGQLYAAEDRRRDSAFSIFYMGINLGAFLSPLACGYVGQRINWRLGFVLSGLGMVLGLIQFVVGGKHLGGAGVHPGGAATRDDMRREAKRLGAAIGGGLGLLVVLGMLDWAGVMELTAVRVSNAVGAFLLIAAVGFFGWLLVFGDWTATELKRLVAVGVFFVASALFWAMFEQAGSTLNLFAQRSTDKQILGFSYPASWLQSANAFFIITLAPVFAWVWLKLGSRDPSSPVKFGLGLVTGGLGFVLLAVAAQRAEGGVLVSSFWLVGVYLLHTVGELCLSPVGLSTMTKLAPTRISGMLMGVWFLATSVGNYLAGRTASFYEALPLDTLFGTVGVFGMGAGVLLLLFVRPIQRLMVGVK
jgi:POT family proton-dependent oligopeptide transporter